MFLDIFFNTMFKTLFLNYFCKVKKIFIFIHGVNMEDMAWFSGGFNTFNMKMKGNYHYNQ